MKTGEKFLIYPQFMRMEKPAGKVYRPMERKAAVSHFTQTLAKNLAPKILVNANCSWLCQNPTLERHN